MKFAMELEVLSVNSKDMKTPVPRDSNSFIETPGDTQGVEDFIGRARTSRRQPQERGNFQQF